MLCGLNNVVQASHKLMDIASLSLDFSFAYLDGSFVQSVNKARRLQHLRELLSQVSKRELILNLSKCRFGCSTMGFLRHVTKHRNSTTTEEVLGMYESVHLTSVKALQEFIGMVTFYHWFILQAAA